MAITIITNGEHRHDQSSGIQVDGTLNKDDVELSNTLAELPVLFETFLNTLAIPLALRDNAADYEAAHEDPLAGFFVEVTPTSGEMINDLFFSQSDGSLFNGQIATHTYDPEFVDDGNPADDVTENITVVISGTSRMSAAARGQRSQFSGTLRP